MKIKGQLLQYMLERQRKRFINDAAIRIMPDLLALPYPVFSGVPGTQVDCNWDNMNNNHARAARCAYSAAEALWEERQRRKA